MGIEKQVLLEEAWEEQEIEEHRLEIENRIRNLFWTVSGDYMLDLYPDVETFKKSKQMALYDAIKQGAFARFFDSDELAEYVMKKVYLGAVEAQLIEVVQLAIEVAVYPCLRKTRRGVEEIRKEAYSDFLRLHPDQEQVSDDEDRILQAKKSLMKNVLGEKQPDNDILMQLSVLDKAEKTDDIIAVVDRIYNAYCDQTFEEKKGNLETVRLMNPELKTNSREEECWDDEEYEHIRNKFLKNLKRSMLRLDIAEDHGQKLNHIPGENDSATFQKPNRKMQEKVHECVELNYGRSYISESQQRYFDEVLCRNIHRGCRIHFTEGVLHHPIKKNNQYRYAQLMSDKNRMYYYGNHRIIKRNIANLADALDKMLTMRKEEEVWKHRSGELVASRLWKVNRSEDDRFFNKKSQLDESRFVVDILLDGSGSQLNRQQQIAIQGYIISMALTQVGIPHRVASFFSFWDHTVLQRFRDYDDDKDMNTRIFEYQASASNRDGLAIKAICEDLKKREEEHRILIVLSDGKPNDLGGNGRPNMQSLAYVGEAAVRDTALAVRKARSEGITVMGIFAGNNEDLAAERKIYGKDFAYIRKINNFSQIVGNYLCKKIEEDTEE